MTIKMNYFDYDLIESYYTKSLVGGDCWIFLSHGNESIKPVSDNADKIATTFLEKAIAAIRLYPQDYAFMIPIRFWQQSQIYTEYDDTVNIEKLPYFVAVEPEIESGNYHVFKCISNNYGAASLEKPTFNQNITSGIYEGGDGYIWKYMTSVPYIEYRKFTAKKFMPIFRNKSVELISNTGIYNIKVQNRDANFRYELFGGEVKKVDAITNKVIISSIRRLSGNVVIPVESNNQSLDFQIENFYADRVFRVDSSMTNNLIGTKSYRIFGSGVDQSSERFLTLNSVEGINIGDAFEITPEVVIRGDGAGATAIPIFKDDRIVSIRMLSYGNGYKNATAYISKPKFGFSSDEGAVEAILRPIVSPIGGHGSNAVRELVSKSISLAVLVSSGQNSKIPSTGTYSKIGLVKSPVFTQSALFTRRNASVVPERVNEVFLENVIGIFPGMAVKFGNSIPIKTTVKSVSESTNSIFLSADVNIRIPELSNIEFSSVTGTFDNRIRIVAENLPADLKAGETVTQPRPQGNVTAIVHTVNFQTNEVYLMQYSGDFSDTLDPSQPILTRLGSIGINTIEYSPYEQKTGEVLYISDVRPIIREADRVEQLRVVLQF